MYRNFCSTRQLKKILDDKAGIKGYIITITQRSTFDISIWIEENVSEIEIHQYVEEKTSEINDDTDKKFIETIELLTDVDVEGNDTFIEDLKSKKIETTIYPTLNSWIGKKASKKRILNTPVITFYSYKGGVGRSTALAIIARQLKEIHGLKVAILDFDIEAPGLYYLFNCKDQETPYGLLDYFRHQLHLNRKLKKNELKNYCIEFGKEDQEGKIYLFNTFSKQDNDNYLEKIAYVDFDMFVRARVNYVDLLLENIQEEIKPDVILVDCRTGFSEISGMFINDSDLVSIFLGISPQNDFGIKTILDSYYRNNKDKVLYSPSFIYNFSVLPQQENQVKNKVEEKKLIERIYKNMQGVFGERLREPDFGENDLKFNFIYRTPKLENNTFINIDQFIDTNKIDAKGEIKLNTNDLADLYKKGLKHVTETIFSKNKNEIKEYQPVLHMIIDLINSKANSSKNEIEHNKNSVLKILNEIKANGCKVGSEGFESIGNVYDKYFFTDRFFKDIDKNLIIGNSGSGKTAIFEILKYHIDKFRVGALSIVGFNQQSLIHQYYSLLVNSYVGNLSIKQWENLWIIFLAISFKEKGLLDDDILVTISDFLEKKDISVLLQYCNESDYIEKICKKVHEASKEKVHYVLYDDLEGTFTEKQDMQLVLSGLLALWEKLKSKNIIPKLFIDNYMYNTYFDGKVTENIGTTRIAYTFVDSLAILLKRLYSSSEGIHRHFRSVEDSNYFTLMNYIKSSKLIIRDEDDLREANELYKTYPIHAINTLFGNVLDNKYNSAKIITWFIDYFSDNNGEISPRDIIMFLMKVTDDYLTNFEEYYNDVNLTERIFPTHLLFNQKNYSWVAESKYSDLLQKYNNTNVEVILKGFKHLEGITFPIEVNTLKNKLTEALELKGIEAAQYVRTLENIGVIKQLADKFYMSPIYLSTFKKVNSEYLFYDRHYGITLDI